MQGAVKRFILRAEATCQNVPGHDLTQNSCIAPREQTKKCVIQGSDILVRRLKRRGFENYGLHPYVYVVCLALMWSQRHRARGQCFRVDSSSEFSLKAEALPKMKATAIEMRLPLIAGGCGPVVTRCAGSSRAWRCPHHLGQIDNASTVSRRLGFCRGIQLRQPYLESQVAQSNRPLYPKVAHI